ncbi:polysaccharide deacetylase family protein [Streptomyces sp. NPDC058665]|uniref:polysaccharide deacetylase family protein n=1 Tax=Streptomyces sp. NPDC058665 TaxID=3346586 RepID=UPI0036638DBE
MPRSPGPATPTRRRLLTTAPTLALAAAHIAPAGTWLAGPRRAFFPGLAGVGRADHVALTFDDGPDPRSTPRFLDLLDELHTRATFFMIGTALLRHPRLGREITRRGHEVAVHGWTHNHPWLPTPAQDTHDLARAAQTVCSICGASPLWYRPPYGILTGGRLLAARRTGLRPILWTAWGKDWTAEATAASVLANVRHDLRGGGTVLLHDSDQTSAPGCWQSTLEALPDLVGGWRSEGMEVGPLVEHWGFADDPGEVPAE